MMRSWRNALVLTALMTANYGLIAVSFRMLAKGSYLGVGLSDGLIAWWGFTTTKRIQTAETRLEKVGYAVGGVVGSLIGLRLTQ